MRMAIVTDLELNTVASIFTRFPRFLSFNFSRFGRPHFKGGVVSTRRKHE